MSIAIVGIIATASGAVLTMSVDANEQGSSRAELQREGLLAMERMTSGLRRATFLLIPNQHTPSRDVLAFSGLVNDDGDFYFGDPLFPKYDEDLATDMDEDGANGMLGWDDDGDGAIDERAGIPYIASDEFNDLTYGGSDGNQPWLDASWIESNDDGSFKGGLVQVATGPGMNTYALRFGGDELALKNSQVVRSLDGRYGPEALFSFRYAQSGAPGGTVMVSVQKGASGWTDLQAFAVGGHQESTVQTFDVSDYLGSTLSLRFASSGTTGASGYAYFDDIRVRTIAIGAGSWSGDDDEDGEADEDPIDGIDNDLDGNVDEDPGGDTTDDGAPGLVGIDDDGDGFVDEGNSSDDDEDGSLAELGLLPVIYSLDTSAHTLKEYDKSTTRTVVLVDHVTHFQVDYESPSRVMVQLELTGDDGRTLRFSETVCLRNGLQKTGKRVR
jgi:hypothetical protein